jgi:uncharacterized protein YcfJ
MSMSFTVGAVVGAIVVTAGGATAAYKAVPDSHSATVVSTRKATRTVMTPRQECRDEQVGDAFTWSEERCATVYDSRELPAGYDVVYLLDGKQHHVRLDHDPGRQIAVRDGQIVVSADRT